MHATWPAAPKRLEERFEPDRREGGLECTPRLQ